MRGQAARVIQGMGTTSQEDELLEEAASFRKAVTGVDNTVFILPKGNTRHAPRIKVAIDPPDSLDPRTVGADGQSANRQPRRDISHLAFERRLAIHSWVRALASARIHSDGAGAQLQLGVLGKSVAPKLEPIKRGEPQQLGLLFTDLPEGGGEVANNLPIVRRQYG